MAILINAYSTLVDPVEIEFAHQLHGHRDRQDLELAEHLNGFIGFVMDSGKREMTSSLYAVMRHLQRVRNHYSFEITEDELDALSDWGWQSNSLFFLADRSVRDPAGAVLVDPETGMPDENAEIPFPADARQRKLNSEALMAEQGIEVPDVLPPVIGEQEVVLRSADEVAWRALALFIVAVRAESLASNQPIDVERFREKSPMAFEAMSPMEVEFLNDNDPEQQIVINMAWRYECLYVLQWALLFHEQLAAATSICDVPLVAQTMVDRDDRQMVNMSRLRPVTQILDQLDLNQRLLWATRQAGLDSSESPGGFDGGVIAERQHALNWLVRFEEADWDDVDIPS